MKQMKRTATVLISGCLLFGAMAPLAAAKDVRQHTAIEIDLNFKDIKEAAWAEGYIKKMKWKHILQGYEDGTFRPNQSVTQVEAIITAVKLMGLENEAKAKPTDTKLHFKDADLIDKQYSWAKGYILVALEHGLFDSDEDRLQPAKAASRVWVASLLVKSLGLEAEALTQMTKVPDFTDAKQIPAGAVGYINAAVGHNLISGYPNGAFLPNKPVTRAEMATLLDRTNEGKLEQEGAIRVNGTIQAISFSTGDVQSANGQITVKSFTGETNVYAIAAALPVQQGTDFIPAVQLTTGSAISLVVKDQVVLEASLLSGEAVDATASVQKFKVELELKDDVELEWKYVNRGGVAEAKIEERDHDIRGEEAVARMKELLVKMNLSPSMSKQEITTKVLQTLGVAENGYEEAEIEITFANGRTIEIELEKGDKDKPSKPEQQNLGIREFELKVELSGKNELDIKYSYKNGRIDAEVEKGAQKHGQKLKGKEAVAFVTDILTKAALNDSMNSQEIATRVLNALDIKTEHMKKVHMKVDFLSNKQLELT